MILIFLLLIYSRPYFAAIPKVSRQKQLERFFFECKCEACINDYGQFESLEKLTCILQDSNCINIKILEKYHEKYAEEALKILIDLLDRYDDLLNKEFHNFTALFSMCYNILLKNISVSARSEVDKILNTDE